MAVVVNMIASAPKRDEIVEENTSLMDYTQNLFAGLTFPEVPKSDPRNVHKKAARPSTLMMEEFEHDNVLYFVLNALAFVIISELGCRLLHDRIKSPFIQICSNAAVS